MLASPAIAVTLGTVATIAVANAGEPARAMQELLNSGYSVMAEGELTGAVECAPQLAGITLDEIRRGYDTSCFHGTVTKGSFKRLKGTDGEFVCVSFKDWACYSSPGSN
jgi:hypothetical protein